MRATLTSFGDLVDAVQTLLHRGDRSALRAGSPIAMVDRARDLAHRHDQEATRPHRRVEEHGALGWRNDPREQLNDWARGEVLPAITLQVRPDVDLVSGPRPRRTRRRTPHRR